MLPKLSMFGGNKLGISLPSLGGLSRPTTNEDLIYGESYPPKASTQERISKSLHSPPRDAKPFDEDTVEYWKEKYRVLNEVLQENVILLDSVEEKNRELKISFDTDLKNIQRTVFQQVAETYSPKTDDDLQTEIKKLRNGITSWAKKSARESLKHLSSEDLALFSSHLSERISLEPDDGVLEKFFHRQKFLGLLLCALLSHTIHWEIIRNPFFLAKQPRGIFDRVKTDLSVFLDPEYMKMYAYMTEIDEVEAHRWRSERVRGFQNEKQAKKREAADHESKFLKDPSTINNMDDSTSLVIVDSPRQDAGEIRATLRRAPTLPTTYQVDGPCKQARELFVAGFAKILIDETREDFEDQLDQIFMRAGNLSLDIWARKSNTICSFAKQLQNEIYIDDSKEIVAHELFLPEDRSILQGKHFSLLVHPLIEVYGTEEGQNYSTGRVLAPAVAWYLPS